MTIDPSEGATNVLRARALYAFCWTVIGAQTVNIVVLTRTFGRWEIDQTIALTAALIMLGMVLCLRYFKIYSAYSLLITALCLISSFFTAVLSGTGINTSLIPLLVLLPMLNCFLATRRIAWICSAVIVTYFLVLYNISMGSAEAELAVYAQRTAQRTLQAIIGTMIATIMGTIFATNTYRAFRWLEQGIVRAREAEHAKSEFLASMSHELRTPLNGVLGLTEALENTKLDDEQRRLLRTVQSSGRSLLHIVNDILDLSKIEANKLAIVETPFAPRSLLYDLQQMWQPAAAKKGLDLHVDVDDAVPATIKGDDFRIRQIVDNLVSNGLKFTTEGSLTIAMKVDWIDAAEHLLVTVTDTGMGLSEEQQARIFGAFEQATVDIAKAHGGTGLGLSICRRLAEMMDGSLSVTSTEGTGSTFTLRFPLKISSTEETVTGPDMEAAVAPLPSLHILVVDDNAINQMVAEQFIKAMGMTSKSVSSGIDCLAALSVGRYDVVLMDKHMPGLSGLDTLRQIRDLPGPMRDVPVVACTADALAGEREALIQQGFTEYLSKPLTGIAMRQMMHTLIHDRAVLKAA
ncbi:ATP-binding protein [Parvularcula sp. LCG005]|uniref:ATP-binding protein n=1 Tax=Parvularcula sp. LCG005 TaxID=3078805 RepID=UPI0029436A8C|nr:ATP-binding protein [Parvularcula sp. LCG005]WOI54039.1 ATP-binding protein [Parvularcula sp. LCG005]